MRTRMRRVRVKLSGIHTWLEAILVLLVVRMGLALLRYQRLLRWLGRSAQMVQTSKPARMDAKARVVKAMRRARRFGMTNTSCLEEALTIQWMLRRRNIESQVQIGVKRTQDEQLLGHAWVECAGEIVSTDLASPASYIVLTPSANGLPNERYRWSSPL